MPGWEFLIDMGTFYFFSDEQLKKLKLDDLIKLAGYYHVRYDKDKPNEDKIIRGILLAQERLHDYGYVSDDSQSHGMSVRVKRIQENSRKEQ